MKRLNGPEIWQTIFVPKLHQHYIKNVPTTKKFESLLAKLGGKIVLDHAATRTPEKELHDFLTRVAAAFGLVICQKYDFPEKHLTAVALDLPDGSGFKWFSTLVLYKELSPSAIAAVEEDIARSTNRLSEKGLSFLDKLEKDKALSDSEASDFCDELVNTFFKRQGKPLKKTTLEAIVKESNELANALLMGPCFNHIAYLINALDIKDWYGTEVIQVLNDTMQREGFTMLPAIQGKAGGPLRQTSTMADKLKFTIEDANGSHIEIEHPAMFLEFIQRGTEQDENGKTCFDASGKVKTFKGFVATNTIKLYESTKAS